MTMRAPQETGAEREAERGHDCVAVYVRWSAQVKTKGTKWTGPLG